MQDHSPTAAQTSDRGPSGHGAHSRFGGTGFLLIANDGAVLSGPSYSPRDSPVTRIGNKVRSVHTDQEV